MNLYYDTKQEADDLNARITADCKASGIWDGTTSNYCVPDFIQDVGQWLVPIIPGYEQFFTDFELSIANNNMSSTTKAVLQDISFCKQIKVKLLAAFKQGPTLPQNTYRTMSDLFWYAKDAADNGNPTNLKLELEAMPNEAALGLAGWDALRASLIADIDSYLALES